MPRRRGGGVAEGFPGSSDLEALIAAAGPPEVPPNLGNFPSAQGDPTAPGESDTHEEPVPEAPAPPAPEPEEEEAGEEDEELSAKLRDLARENEFLRLAMRAGQQAPAPQTDPRSPQQQAIAAIDALLPNRVTPQDVETIRNGDPQVAAEYLFNAMRMAAAAGWVGALNQARSEYTQVETQKASGQSLRQLMYGRHPDLEPFADLVMTHAQRQAQVLNLPNRPMAPYEQEALVEATSRSVRSQLAEWGINPAAGTPATRPHPVSRRARLRPAYGEGGSGAPRRGAGQLNQFDRELFQLVNAR